MKKFKNREVTTKIEKGKFGTDLTVTIVNDTQNVSHVVMDWYAGKEALDKLISKIKTNADFITITEVRELDRKYNLY